MDPHPSVAIQGPCALPPWEKFSSFFNRPSEHREPFFTSFLLVYPSLLRPRAKVNHRPVARTQRNAARLPLHGTWALCIYPKDTKQGTQSSKEGDRCIALCELEKTEPHMRINEEDSLGLLETLEASERRIASKHPASGCSCQTRRPPLFGTRCCVTHGTG